MKNRTLFIAIACLGLFTSSLWLKGGSPQEPHAQITNEEAIQALNPALRTVLEEFMSWANSYRGKDKAFIFEVGVEEKDNSYYFHINVAPYYFTFALEGYLPVNDKDILIFDKPVTIWNESDMQFSTDTWSAITSKALSWLVDTTKLIKQEPVGFDNEDSTPYQGTIIDPVYWDYQIVDSVTFVRMR